MDGGAVTESRPGLDERGLPGGYPFQPEWETTPREYRDAVARGERVVLVDCRTTQEREIASIPGSIHVPLHELANHVEALRAHEDDPIVVHCHQGGRSLRMTAQLRSAGFGNVKSMAGGIHLWSLDVDPSVPIY